MRKSTLSVLLIAVTVLTVAALLIWPGIASSAIPSERPMRVEAALVTLGGVEKAISVSGTLCYQGEFFSIVPQSGVVAQVYVTEGEAVRKGQALYRLDASAQEELLERAYQALAQAKSGTLESAMKQIPALAQAETPEMLKDFSYTEKAQAQVDELEAAVEGMTVRAYQEGQVLQVLVRQGELTAAGSAGALLSSTNQEIRAQVTARERTRIQKGMRARVGYEGVEKTMATVSYVGALSLDGTTGLTSAQIALEVDEPVDLPLGAQLEVDILLESAAGVPVAPVEALTAADTLWQIYEGRAYALEPELPLLDDRKAWVKGVSLGTQIILNPPETLKEGQRVKIEGAGE